MNRDIVIIEHIIVHAERILNKIENKNLEGFLSNNDDKDIVCFNFLQIGELAKSLSIEFCKNYSLVDWKGLKGIRDKIVHGYGEIDFSLIYAYCIEEAPLLLSVCKQALKELTQK